MPNYVMPYFGLLHKDGSLTDISDSQPTAGEGDEIVEVVAKPNYPSMVPLTYHRETKQAIIHSAILEELQRQYSHMMDAESDPQWRECCDVQPVLSEPSADAGITYPPEIVARLIENLNAASTKPARSINAAILRNIVDVAYFSSHSREEGQNITFNIALVNLEDAVHMIPQRGWTPLPFATHRPFDVSEITKLAPALDGSQSAIGVRIEPDNSLKIWGILLTDRSPYKMKRGEVGGCGFFGPPHLRVIVPARSHLIFELFAKRILEYRAGQIIAHYLPVFTKDGHIFRYLHAKKACGDFPVRRPIHLLARRIMDAGHGGALLVVDLAEASILKSFCRLKYDMNSDVNILRNICRDIEMKEYFLTHIEKEKQMSQEWQHLYHEVSENYNKLSEAIDGIARLASVDGALAISTDLSVLGFGIRIEYKDSPAVYLARDLFARQIELFDLASLGTRHTSAAAFASRCPRSLVFVASQDGVGAVFRRHKDKVIMWRPVELDVLIDLDRPSVTPSPEESPSTT